MNYNYIIIGGNNSSLERLRSGLKPYLNMEELGHANTARDGIALALKCNPHIIFLNMDVDPEHGFEILKRVKEYGEDLPLFIIINNSGNYTKEAVNNDVLYLLDNPINPDDLALAIAKVEKHLLAFRNLITIKNSEGHFFIDLNRVSYISSSDNYCIVHRVDTPSMMIARTLKNLETVLPSNFVRIHKCHIINKDFLQMLNTSLRIVRMNYKDIDSRKELELPVGNLYFERARNHLLYF